MRAIAILLTFGSTALAQPAPPTLAMDYEQGENIHIANQGGAINRHLSIRLRVDLQSSTRARVTETGTSREHNLYRNFTTEELQDWRAVWSGSYKQTATSLSLDLALERRTCTHAKKASGRPDEQLPCRGVSKQLRLDCKPVHVALRGPTNAQGVKPSRDAWQCQAAPTTELDLTPRTWTLGKTACLKVFGGRGGINYESCPTP